MAINTFPNIDPLDVRLWGVDFSNELAGDTITNATVTLVPSFGTSNITVTAVTVVASSSQPSGQVNAWYSNATVNTVTLAQYVVTTVSGQRLKRTMTVICNSI